MVSETRHFDFKLIQTTLRCYLKKKVKETSNLYWTCTQQKKKKKIITDWVYHLAALAALKAH